MTRPKLRSPAMQHELWPGGWVQMTAPDWRRVWAVVRAAAEERDKCGDLCDYNLCKAVDALRKAQK